MKKHLILLIIIINYLIMLIEDIAKQFFFHIIKLLDECHKFTLKEHTYYITFHYATIAAYVQFNIGGGVCVLEL